MKVVDEALAPGLFLLGLGWLGTYVQTQHDDHDDVVGQGEIDIVHDQQLLVSEARLSLDAGITRRFAASLVLPVRVVGTSIRYLDTRGSEVRLVHENIHHRNETVAGIGDLMLLGSTSLSVGRWRLTARAGLTLPTGRTEENPFALGDQGLRHQHIQLGTGTLNPVVGAEVARSWGRWRFGVFALSQQVVYENAKGYQAGDRYATGAVLRRQLGPRWTVRGSVDVLAESAERWDGMTPTDDGNRGRFDLIFGAGASWAATKQLGLDLALKVPVITRAVGGQLDMPAILELGASWSFGGPARPADAHGGDDHDGHDHDGHDHDHGHDDHGHDGHGHDGHGHDGHDGHGDDHDGHDGHDAHAHVGAPPVDASGLDVADLGKPGEAVDLVPVTGKVTIFDFWATWCEPCKVLEPALLEIARAHPEIVAIRRIDTVDWDSAAGGRPRTPKGFNQPHQKVIEAAGRMVIERRSECG
ncbi:MAG: thioredoxin domain-containing protein, partial [Kofleriaceae bacterium]